MKMSPREIFTLRDYLGPELKGRTISDARRVVSLTDVLEQTCVVGRFSELSSRSVLLAVSDQLISALAMTELDGVARRMLLCPPDLDADHIQTLIDDADIDAIVTDQPPRWAHFGVYQVVAVRAPERRGAKRKDRARDRVADAGPGYLGCAEDRQPYAGGTDRRDRRRRSRLVKPRRCGPVSMTSGAIGGLQIFLRAIIGGGSMVLTEPGEAIADHVARLNAQGVTHVSGTPSHWRKLLMSGAASGFSPRYIHLSGEIADQALLDGLRQTFPGAAIGQADASTEAAFAVSDAGFH